MPVRWTPFEIFTGTGAAFLCIVFACVFLEAGRIETGIAERAVRALDEAGLYWFAVAPEGRRLILTGTAPDAAAIAAAAARIADVPGAGAIENRIAPVGAAGACQSELDEVLARRPVTFRKGQAEPAPGSDPTIAAVAVAIRQCGVRVEVAVHAGTAGSAAMGLVQSQRRAEHVARRLVAQGVSAEQVLATGYGVAQPVAPLGTGAAESGDATAHTATGQRVEFRVLGAAT